jgi:hypothetical protein
MCKGNFDFDRDVDGGDAFVFKTHFGRSAFKNPCPPDGPAPVEKTWQTTSYATGDDGDHQSGMIWPEPRFFDNQDGTITDKLTGLIWLKDANCFGQRTWYEALADCNQLTSGSCGLTDGSAAGDWRLGNIDELLSLTDHDMHLPALPSSAPFINVMLDQPYWSSTSYAANTDHNAWGLVFADGSMSFGSKSSSPDYVWPVRAGH